MAMKGVITKLPITQPATLRLLLLAITPTSKVNMIQKNTTAILNSLLWTAPCCPCVYYTAFITKCQPGQCCILATIKHDRNQVWLRKHTKSPGSNATLYFCLGPECVSINSILSSCSPGQIKSANSCIVHGVPANTH